MLFPSKLSSFFRYHSRNTDLYGSLSCTVSPRNSSQNLYEFAQQYLLVKPVRSYEKVPFSDKTSANGAYVESGFVEIGAERNRWDRQVRAAGVVASSIRRDNLVASWKIRNQRVITRMTSIISLIVRPSLCKTLAPSLFLPYLLLRWPT